MSIFDLVITTLGDAVSIVVIVHSFLTFILPPYHPVREALGRLLEPLYGPLRRIIPPVGMFDLTPIILIVIVQVIVRILTSLF